jgi:glycine betaine/choline ABC-type transport system substrate-binding protein
MDRKAFFKASSIALGFALAGGCVRGPRVVVGSKNFGEQILLAEIAAQQIERKMHVIVERKLEMGGTMLAHEAVLKGEIDFYPEYTGTALLSILHRSAESDPSQVLKAVREGYAPWHLRWLDPLGFNNSFAIVIRQKDAADRHVKTLSDAAGYAKGWKMGAGYEFVKRPDGLSGLLKTYGLKLQERPQTMDLGLLYAAIDGNSVDMVVGNGTDGQLSSPQYVELTDDKHYFPPYQAAYVIREETFAKFPKLEGVLQGLAGKLDDKTMRELNYQVEVLHRSGTKVAAEWLTKFDATN